ncbi:IS91 family transposase, partial [Shigella flexneri]
NNPAHVDKESSDLRAKQWLSGDAVEGGLCGKEGLCAGSKRGYRRGEGVLMKARRARMRWGG